MEQPVATTSTSDQHKTDAVKGWSKEEKFYLLQALKTFGSQNITLIQEDIPSKTPEEISKAIEYYRCRSLKRSILEKEQRTQKTKSSIKPRVPLASWAKFLTDTYTFEELQTETSTAVRLIADLESIPLAARTDNVDFRKIYLLMANAMEGKTLKADKMTASVFNKCIIETALSSKAFIKTSAYKYVINSITMNHSNGESLFLRPTKDHELGTLRHLTSQLRYNPFKIQEEYLSHSPELILHNGGETKPDQGIERFKLKEPVTIQKFDLFNYEKH